MAPNSFSLLLVAQEGSLLTRECGEGQAGYASAPWHAFAQRISIAVACVAARCPEPDLPKEHL